MHDDPTGLNPGVSSPTESIHAPKRPSAGSIRRVLLGAAIAVGLMVYLFIVFLFVHRDGYGYTYLHFLFDYHFGVTRRALEGEIARHLFPPPYWVGNFRDFSHWVLGLAMMLFVAIALAMWRRGRTTGWLLLVLVIATSPLTFKQMAADEGRQDIFGVVVLESTLLLALLRSPAPAAYFLSVVLVPLTLVNENHLLLYLPSCLVIVMAKVAMTSETRRWRWLMLPWAAFITGFIINLLLPPPRVPYRQYEAYLASKSIYRLPGGTPDRWLYTHVRENLDFAVTEWHRLEPEHLRHAADYLVFFGITVIIAALIWAGIKRTDARFARGFLCAMGFITAFYVVLCRTASDEARWLANFGTCVLFVGLFWCDACKARPIKAYVLALIVAFQLMLHEGFGITVPDMNLERRFTRIEEFYRGNPHREAGS